MVLKWSVFRGQGKDFGPFSPPPCGFHFPLCAALVDPGIAFQKAQCAAAGRGSGKALICKVRECWMRSSSFLRIKWYEFLFGNFHLGSLCEEWWEQMQGRFNCQMCCDALSELQPGIAVPGLHSPLPFLLYFPGLCVEV